MIPKSAATEAGILFLLALIIAAVLEAVARIRLREQNGDAGRWLARRAGSWTADIGRLEEYARQRGNNAPDLRTDYGELSELSHPTRNAT